MPISVENRDMEVAVLEFRIFQSKSQISEYKGNFRIFVENPGIHPTYDFHPDFIARFSNGLFFVAYYKNHI